MILIYYNLIILSFILFFSGWLTFAFNFKFLLINLLSLEYMILSLFLFLYSFLMFFKFELFFSLVFFTFSVCEGVLGLCLLIIMIRGYGNNYFQAMNLFTL